MKRDGVSLVRDAGFGYFHCSGVLDILFFVFRHVYRRSFYF